jgi:hypothetical protein
MKPAKSQRQGSALQDAKKREAPKQVVFKIHAYIGEDVIYATPERGVFHSRVRLKFRRRTNDE